LKVALLGPRGTYTHQAAEEYFDNLEPVFCSTIRDVFDSDTEVKFVPIENSLGGGVMDTIDLFKEREETVTGEITLGIQHALISDSESIEEIEKVKSHPQALAQSKNIVENNSWETEETSSTAEAVTDLEEGEAALASEIAAKINDKNIIRRSVQDKDVNVTRFLVLNGEPEASDKSSLILEPEEDRPGILHAMLSCFSGHQINLSHIQSRPTKERLGEYYFYVEAQIEDRDLEKAVKCLETYGGVQKLGEYKEASRPGEE